MVAPESNLVREIRTGLRFIVSGSAGVLIGLVLYEATFWLNPTTTYRATSSYVIAYVLGIFVQHALHRSITFGGAVSYARSLRRTFLVYPAVLVVSSALNLALVNGLDWHHRAAFWATIVVSGALSYLGLRLFAFRETGSRGAAPDAPDRA